MKLIDGPPIPIEDIKRVLDSSIPVSDKNNPKGEEQCQVPCTFYDRHTIYLTTYRRIMVPSPTCCAGRRMEYARYIMRRRSRDCGSKPARMPNGCCWLPSPTSLRCPNRDCLCSIATREARRRFLFGGPYEKAINECHGSIQYQKVSYPLRCWGCSFGLLLEQFAN
jgi:hypothetical protein